jgi:hypothetical protein
MRHLGEQCSRLLNLGADGGSERSKIQTCFKRLRVRELYILTIHEASLAICWLRVSMDGLTRLTPLQSKCWLRAGLLRRSPGNHPSFHTLFRAIFYLRHD